MRIKNPFNNYIHSIFNKFKFDNAGDTIIINKTIEILENKGYTKVKTKCVKPKQYYIGKDGYELIFKDARYDLIYYIRQGDNKKVAILSHIPGCYWWTDHYIYRKALSHSDGRNYQIPTNGYIEQTEDNVSIVIRKLNKLINKTPFKY